MKTDKNNLKLSDNDKNTVFGSKNQFRLGMTVCFVSNTIILLYLVCIVVCALCFIEIKFLFYEIILFLFGVIVLLFDLRRIIKLIKLRRMFEAGKIKKQNGKNSG